MLRQALFTNARAIRSAAPIATRTTSALRAQAQLAARPVFASLPVRTARWYSSETKEGAEKKEGEAKAEEGKKEEVEDPLKKKLEAKEKEVVDLKDKYLRLLADFRTLQDRSARDQKSARDFAIQKFAADLLDSVDNLDRALHIVPEEQLAGEATTDHHKHLVSLHEGIKMTETILMQVLAQHGITRLDPIGEKFNAADHEVTMLIPHPEAEDNSVLTVESKGFKLNGRLLRPAKVQVAKKIQV
ncbi:hypothetical protein jhhlp_005512 [Lomentospora prolificans]|uniref:GrpE protein homolog n=1 Tax=Lomentospora prolificans TaxID=41688 RepID=A0A2N3N3A0_9PEZI|nr:hypothetical protein jhhlp_005512 [Lomentospora prolificans]